MRRPFFFGFSEEQLRLRLFERPFLCFLRRLDRDRTRSSIWAGAAGSPPEKPPPEKPPPEKPGGPPAAGICPYGHIPAGLMPGLMPGGPMPWPPGGIPAPAGGMPIIEYAPYPG